MSNIPLTERRNWVGASEVAALFGASPYCTHFELWQYKAGLLQPDSLDEQERIQAGQFLEPSIGQWAAYKWGMQVNPISEYLAHPRIPKMGASLDFISGDGAPIEIKNVDGLRFRTGEWVSDGDEIYDCPVHFLIQVQHQMACVPSNPEYAWLIVCVGGNQLKRMRIDRHPGMIERIEEEVSDFWDSVHSGRCPDPDYAKDHAVINKLFGGSDEVVDLSHDVEAADLASAWADAHQREKVAKAEKSAAMARLRVLGGDAKTVILDDGWTLKASHIKGRVQEVKPYWRFALNQKKESTQ